VASRLRPSAEFAGPREIRSKPRGEAPQRKRKKKDIILSCPENNSPQYLETTKIPTPAGLSRQRVYGQTHGQEKGYAKAGISGHIEEFVAVPRENARLCTFTATRHKIVDQGPQHILDLFVRCRHVEPHRDKLGIEDAEGGEKVVVDLNTGCAFC